MTKTEEGERQILRKKEIMRETDRGKKKREKEGINERER